MFKNYESPPSSIPNTDGLETISERDTPISTNSIPNHTPSKTSTTLSYSIRNIDEMETISNSISKNLAAKTSTSKTETIAKVDEMETITTTNSITKHNSSKTSTITFPTSNNMLKNNWTPPSSIPNTYADLETMRTSPKSNTPSKTSNQVNNIVSEKTMVNIENGSFLECSPFFNDGNDKQVVGGELLFGFKDKTFHFLCDSRTSYDTGKCLLFFRLLANVCYDVWLSLFF